jgi:hypothetical protein
MTLLLNYAGRKQKVSKITQMETVANTEQDRSSDQPDVLK